VVHLNFSNKIVVVDLHLKLITTIFELASTIKMSKYKNKKTRGNKKYRYTAAEVAEICGVSESYVKKLRVQLVDQKSIVAQKVLAVDDLLYDGGTKLLQEVERICTIETKAN